MNDAEDAEDLEDYFGAALAAVGLTAADPDPVPAVGAT